jgi:hypothetical protein
MRKTIPGQDFLALTLIALSLAAPLPLSAAPLDQPPAEAEPQFTNVIEDLPLMPGLQLVDDEDVLFDEPGSGRIAETNAMGPVDIDEVYKFYRRSLPHLGWKAINARTYERGGERLRIDAQANAKVTTVRFTVRPMSEGK